MTGVYAGWQVRNAVFLRLQLPPCYCNVVVGCTSEQDRSELVPLDPLPCPKSLSHVLRRPTSKIWQVEPR